MAGRSSARTGRPYGTKFPKYPYYVRYVSPTELAKNTPSQQGESTAGPYWTSKATLAIAQFVSDISDSFGWRKGDVRIMDVARAGIPRWLNTRERGSDGTR